MTMMTDKIKREDLLDFHFLAAPAISPDGSKIAYKVSRANINKDSASGGYDTDIWICDIGRSQADANRRVTDSGNVKFFSWSADGENIIFASENEDKTIFRRTALDCDSHTDTLFELPHKATEIHDLGSGRFLVMAVFEPEPPNNPEKADFMVFDQLPFVSNGKGYTGSRRTGLVIYDAAGGGFRRITPATMDVRRVSLNKDRSAVLAVASDYAADGVMPIENDVYKIDLVSGKISRLSGGASCTFGSAVWLDGDDSENVVVTATDHSRHGVNENMKIYLLEDEALYCLTPEMDLSMGHPVAGDTSYGCSDREGEIMSCDKGLIFSALLGFKCRICSIGGSGKLSVLTSSVSSVIDYSAGGTLIAYVAYRDLHLPELFLLNIEDGTERRLTSFNDKFFDSHEFSQPIHVSFRGCGGMMIDGWYMRPVVRSQTDASGAARSGKFPTILNIHGGPKAAFGDIYYHEMQCWAAKGYAVIYCNPRGSDGRGGAFADIRGRYGDTDYRDIMDFTDWCVRNLDFVDASRLGVTGGSYGGYMTNWIITQTNRFGAAVSQRGIANWVSKFGGCDIGYYYVEDQHLGTPWRNPNGPWRDSPVSYADSAATPTLFVHSSDDFRCELNQAFQMFTALKANGVEARLCVFNGENHELSRSGKPRNRLARLRVIIDWFDSHIGKGRAGNGRG